jgi:hypothetical protein
MSESNSSTNNALDDLFSESSAVENLTVELPSRGIGYRNIPAEVTIKCLTFEDEKYLANIKDSTEVINDLIKRSTNIEDPEELYLFDKMFLLVMLRKASFGEKIKMQTACPICGEENNLEIDIDGLPVEYLEQDFNGLFEVELEDLNKTAKVRLPVSSDQKYMTSKDSILDNLWRFVTDIGGYNQAPIISAAIKKLTSRDIKSLIDVLKVDDYGIQTRAAYMCVQCKSKNKVFIPFTESFF